MSNMLSGIHMVRMNLNHSSISFFGELMSRVLNKYKDTIPPEAVYIGRPSKWGNVFAMQRKGIEERERVLILFTRYLSKHPELVKDIKDELRGKDLVCFCAPLPCHGDVLLKIANEM